MITLEEVKEHIKSWDEVYILERLNIDASDLIAAFVEKLENNYEQLAKEIEDELYS